MAALTDAPLLEVCDLRQISSSDLNSLLDEEVLDWERELCWDFRPSADLVRRFVEMQSLNGFALRADRELIGYSYQVCDEGKGLIGDFYVRPTPLSPASELTLLSAVVGNLMRTPGIRRIESQLMLLHAPLGQPLPFARWSSAHERVFMQIRSDAICRLAARPLLAPISLQLWSDRMQEEAARLISSAYRGHVDSEINDQYRNIPGARRFLTNIVRFPGCGRFSPRCSYVAVDGNSGRLCGVCLASSVAATSGHITQLCVLPGARECGIGRQLLRASLFALAEAGCQSVTLTVTRSNVSAIRLYEALGFKAVKTFPALVWDDF